MSRTKRSSKKTVGKKVLSKKGFAAAAIAAVATVLTRTRAGEWLADKCYAVKDCVQDRVRDFKRDRTAVPAATPITPASGPNAAPAHVTDAGDQSDVI